MNKNRYCLQCGIPLADNLSQCPECGLQYIDLGDCRDPKRNPFVFSCDTGTGQTFEALVKIDNIEIATESYNPYLYNDHIPVLMSRYDRKIYLTLRCVPYENNGQTILGTYTVSDEIEKET